jgi:purine-nucleoside phosphorylase
MVQLRLANFNRCGVTDKPALVGEAGMTSERVAGVQARAPGFTPVLGLVLGSGLGGLASRVEGAVRIPYADLNGFPASGVSGHAGELVLGHLADLPVAVLAGRAHYYEHGDPNAMREPLAFLKALGADTVLLTNAAGSLRPAVGPGSVMLITDHINWSGLNPLIGTPGDARFVGMARAYDAGLADRTRRVAAAAGLPLAEGVYMWFSGPSFETPAEIRMAQRLGADAVGMSTVPEVILARYFGLKVVALSMITNLGAGMVDEELSHHQTKTEAAKGAERFERLVLALCADLATHTEPDGGRL